MARLVFSGKASPMAPPLTAPLLAVGLPLIDVYGRTISGLCRRMPSDSRKLDFRAPGQTRIQKKERSGEVITGTPARCESLDWITDGPPVCHRDRCFTKAAFGSKPHARRSVRGSLHNRRTGPDKKRNKSVKGGCNKPSRAREERLFIKSRGGERVLSIDRLMEGRLLPPRGGGTKL